MDRIEVHPKKDGTWNWRRKRGDKTDGTGDGYDNRRDAIQAARAANGVETMNLTRDDGTSAGTTRVGQGELSIVLLRLDGTVHGELDHAAGTPGQKVNLTPAQENGNAGLEG